MLRFFRSPDMFLAIAMPAVFFIATVILEQVFKYDCFTACEDGPVENLQVLVLAIAVILGLRVVLMPRETYPRWARIFLTLGVIGCVFAALEEISYGQRLFSWMTPEGWAQINDQGETNLHNTTAWLDQKPRMILEIGVVIGGIILPLLRRYRPASLPDKWRLVYPSDMLFPTAFMAAFIHFYQEICEGIGHEDFYLIRRSSEMQEIYLYWFILLYFYFKRREFTALKFRASAKSAHSQ